MYIGGKKDEEFPWRMGVYFLELHVNGRIYNGGINVVPLHLEKSQVEKMHSFLNEQVHSIIYDFVYSIKSLNKIEDVDLPEYWYYDYARKLGEFFYDFMHAMTKITKHPKEQIQSCYEASAKLGKTDNVSIRWGISNKGQMKNKGAFQQFYYLNKTKRNNNNNKANQWLKNILILWMKDISNVSLAIKKDIAVLQKKINELNTIHEELLEKIEKLSYRRNVGENTKRDLKSRLIMSKKDMIKAQNQHSVLTAWLSLMNSFENKVAYFLNHTFLSDVERNYRKPIMKEYHYFKINEMFESIKFTENTKGNTARLTPVLKPTWQIYEYFCLFKVIDILKQLGFKLTSGINDNIINYYFEDRIHEGARFTLEKGTQVIHIWYDHYHANSANEANSIGEAFYTPFPKKKPDIKVDFFKNEDGNLVHNGTIIFDSKFSKFKDIYNSTYNNSTSEQLISYFSFFYTGKGSRQGGRPCVDRVICLYAGDDTNYVVTDRQPITYLNLFPSIKKDERVAVGEIELLEIFQDILSSYA
ncbi:hypothetical protein ACLM5H_19410 [Fredinandcohnia humi]